MSRLIDADKFLDFIKSELKQHRTDEKHLENIICVLENLPTAFDVDKVVKQLEELKDYRRFNGAKTFDNGFNQGEKYGYNKAIDDLTEKIVGYGTYDYYGNVIDVLEIAEKLKEHKTLNIVHCKDCKHWGTGVAGETENVKCCEYGKYMVGANGYCVYGEKECAE